MLYKYNQCLTFLRFVYEKLTAECALQILLRSLDIIDISFPACDRVKAQVKETSTWKFDTIACQKFWNLDHTRNINSVVSVIWGFGPQRAVSV
jgi:hypothetical protein